MKKLETQVIVIGGGITGCGVLRDLAMRGLDAVLFERGNVCEGTSGNFHGLLHSGGRYAVKDKPAAIGMHPGEPHLASDRRPGH